jgi:hypothetical protein
MSEMTVNKLMCANSVIGSELYIIQYSHDQFMMKKVHTVFWSITPRKMLFKNVCADKLTSKTLINH